jgi:hypothetical protein
MNISQGMKVRVIKDEGTKGMMITADILNRRQVGAEGTVLNYVPGHGGDVWFVQQANGVAAYCYTELSPVMDHSHKWTMEETIEREA